MQTEYAQKIQEMKHLERLKEEEERHRVEVAGERGKYTSLAQEKEKLVGGAAGWLGWTACCSG